MDREDTLKLMAPALTAGAIWLTSKLLRSAYRATLGTPPPTADDLEAPVAKVIAFTTATAVATAVINVAIQRTVARASQRSRAVAAR